MGTNIVSNCNGVGMLYVPELGCRDPGEITSLPANYMLKVETFSLLSEAGIDKFESNTFESGEYKWRLVLYPNGNKADDGENHISLYLCIVDSESLPKGWEVNVYSKFYVYDHVQENYLTIQGAKKWRFHSMKLEWGFAKLLPLKIFKDTSSGYLFYDSCVFGVEVFVTPKFVLKENSLSILKPPTTNNSYTWTLDKFSSIEAKSVLSEVFKVGKIKWRLELLPKGHSTVNGTHLSLFLAVADCDSLPSDWRIYAKYSLCVRDQSGKNLVDNQVTSHWFSAKANSWGFRSFIALKDLNHKGNSYVVNDKLIVQVEFAALGVVKNVT